jgi:hypothetical protein
MIVCMLECYKYQNIPHEISDLFPIFHKKTLVIVILFLVLKCNYKGAICSTNNKLLKILKGYDNNTSVEHKKLIM